MLLLTGKNNGIQSSKKIELDKSDLISEWETGHEHKRNTMNNIITAASGMICFIMNNKLPRSLTNPGADQKSSYVKK